MLNAVRGTLLIHEWIANPDSAVGSDRIDAEKWDELQRRMNNGESVMTDFVSGGDFRPHPVTGLLTPYALLLKHGRAWAGATLPSRMRRRRPRACYLNSWAVASRSPRWLYAEGYAISEDLGFPLQHAWLVDRRTGEAADVTWDMNRTRHAYIGLVFPPDAVRAVTEGRALWRRWPLLDPQGELAGTPQIGDILACTQSVPVPST